MMTATEAPTTMTALDLAELRRTYKRHKTAATWIAGTDEFNAALDRSIRRLGFTRATMTPPQWVEAIESILLFCDRCKGTGDYCWGGTINGRPVHKATCFHCLGSGQQTLDDAYRNVAYIRYAIVAAGR